MLAATASFDTVKPELAIAPIADRTRSTSALCLAAQASTAGAPQVLTLQNRGRKLALGIADHVAGAIKRQAIEVIRRRDLGAC